MSRIGRMPIAIPAGVTVDIAENNKAGVVKSISIFIGISKLEYCKDKVNIPILSFLFTMKGISLQ